LKLLREFLVKVNVGQGGCSLNGANDVQEKLALQLCDLFCVILWTALLVLFFHGGLWRMTTSSAKALEKIAQLNPSSCRKTATLLTLPMRQQEVHIS
jgi:hypothetical protein